MKIGILTLNPCIDRALYLTDMLTPGNIHRVESVVENVAGKGLNQAMVLENLGTICDYFSFGSPFSDNEMDRKIRSHSFRYHKVSAMCGIRINTKVIDSDGKGTELNEAGGPIQKEELEQILSDVDSFDGDILSVCGSIPHPVEKSVYKSIIERAGKRGIITVLDADGEALYYGLRGRPDYIKPNRRELAGLFGLNESDLDCDDKVIALARRIHEEYGTRVLCTLDADGSVYVGSDGIWRVGAAKVPMRGFAGAGDTYLAAFLHARYQKNMDIEECLSFAARASAAKIALGGSNLPRRENIDVMEDVRVERIG